MTVLLYRSLGGEIIAGKSDPLTLDQARTLLECSRAKRNDAARKGEIEGVYFHCHAIRDLTAAIDQTTNWRRCT